MSAVIVKLTRLTLDEVLAVEQLSSLRRLVELGCYGHLAITEKNDALSIDSALRLLERAEPPAVIRTFELEAHEPEGLPAEEYARLDRKLSGELDVLDAESSILVLLQGPQSGVDHTRTADFILFMPDYSCAEEIVDCTPADLALTVLDLLGTQTSGAPRGRLLRTNDGRVSVTAPLLWDEETLLRERLRGLGYVE